ncbi:MAG: M48 family metalloprotease [Pseudoxanthomonas suwonensis]|nr:M48 family metalloprotease [Pseudoxanthomonas suwonensis]
MPRIALLTAALTLSIAAPLAAQDVRLPDMGSSAGTLISDSQQAEYGQMLLSQLRHHGYILDDPQLDAWLRDVGIGLAANSDRPRQSFTFFWMRDRQINAFATLGGYIGLNAGLVLAAESEGQMASVLAHEIAHVTQDHVLRSVERAQRDSIPILLAMLGAIAIAQSSSSGGSSDNASMAALAIGQGLMAQRQINYTRSNESEADRIGMQALARSGYDPNDAAAMFQRMQSAFRANRGGERERLPDYLQTHPVTTARVAEAKQNAERLAARGSGFGGSLAGDNPLLPGSLRIATTAAGGDTGQYGWARERLRVLSANTPAEAVREYRQLSSRASLDDAQRYGLGLARLLAGEGGAAMAELGQLLDRHPGNLWLELAMGEAEARAGRHAAASARFDRLVERMPRNKAVALTYVGVLNERATADAGRRAQAILRPLLAESGSDPVFQARFARASEIAGDPVRAGEAWAEAAFLNGRPEQALLQLNTLKQRDDLDYYARARIDARIASITPTVLELRRQGVRDEVLRGG